MNTIRVAIRPASTGVEFSSEDSPRLCELPSFIKVPRVPGLPTDVTGDALRAMLLARAQSAVTFRRA